MTKVLIIEDDVIMANMISQYLTKFNMVPTVLVTWEEIQYEIESNNHDVVVLDLSLPKVDGLTICKKIREIDTIPIIISSARTEISDKTLGYEMGADDYLAKPYEPRELVLKINAILKRCDRTSTGTKLLEHNLSLYLDGSTIELTQTEFCIVKYLIQNKSRIVTREELLEIVPKIHSDTQSRVIDVYVSKLRQKLHDDPKENHYIKSIWGQGYRWVH